ncbi:MAG: hypothetical protein V3V08_05200 [Nannocystaceae bacterium]
MNYQASDVGTKNASIRDVPRFHLPVLLAVFLPGACVDAPITSAHLSADGQLRASMTQHAFDSDSAGNRLAARTLGLTAVLAPEANGALEDATVFRTRAHDPEAAVNLHLRADHLDAPRAVRFVWSHGEQRRERIDFLTPSDTLILAASLPLRDAVPGEWAVEVSTVSAQGPGVVLYRREFEVRQAD